MRVLDAKSQKSVNFILFIILKTVTLYPWLFYAVYMLQFVSVPHEIMRQINYAHRGLSLLHVLYEEFFADYVQTAWNAITASEMTLGEQQDIKETHVLWRNEICTSLGIHAKSLLLECPVQDSHSKFSVTKEVWIFLV